MTSDNNMDPHGLYGKMDPDPLLSIKSKTIEKNIKRKLFMKAKQKKVYLLVTWRVDSSASGRGIVESSGSSSWAANYPVELVVYLVGRPTSLPVL